MIYIVGLGPGNKDYILNKSLEVMKNCDLILGFKRAIDSIDYVDKEKISVSKLIDITKEIELNKGLDIAIVASGDPNFFGIADYLSKNLKEKIEVIPGITSFQYLMSKLNKSWSYAYTGSLHGREDELIEKVLKNKLSIWLCDTVNSPQNICRKLYLENIKCEVVIGENLSYENEVILKGKPEEFKDKNFSSLSVILIERGEMNDIN